MTAPVAPDPAAPDPGLEPDPSPWREAVRWIVLILVVLVLPMLLLGATMTQHTCGGG